MFFLFSFVRLIVLLLVVRSFVCLELCVSILTLFLLGDYLSAEEGNINYFFFLAIVRCSWLSWSNSSEDYDCRAYMHTCSLCERRPKKKKKNERRTTAALKRRNKRKKNWSEWTWTINGYARVYVSVCVMRQMQSQTVSYGQTMIIFTLSLDKILAKRLRMFILLSQEGTSSSSSSFLIISQLFIIQFCFVLAQLSFHRSLQEFFFFLRTCKLSSLRTLRFIFISFFSCFIVWKNAFHPTTTTNFSEILFHRWWTSSMA